MRGRGVNATRQVAAPLCMLIALVVVAGLLAATPAACWCPAGDHFGQLVHPRFAHEHASDHAVAAFGQPDAPDGDTRNVATEPAWSSAAGGAMSQWQAGLQILPPLPTILQADVGGARLAVEVARPRSHLPAPSFPPPR